MESEESGVMHIQKRSRPPGSVSPCSVHLWYEVRRRWMILGVLSAVTLAVLAPHLGAVGGVLHSELTGCVPLMYVYYAAGRRARAPALWASVRAHAPALGVCVVHAHLLAPALCAALVTALRDGLDYRIVKGVMLWSRGGGCAWLSLALSSHRAAPGAAALVYATALLAGPLATTLICGRASLPSLLGVSSTLATTSAPFLAGMLRSGGSGGGSGGGRAVRLCALGVLYAECCERLHESAGALRVQDVVVTLALEAAAVAALAAASALYVRCGVLSASDARLVTLCALPRGLDTRWEAADGCVSAGLVRLPAVFLAPTQALLLAALVPDDCEEEGSPAWTA